jgi:hydrogenase maturation protein HypF
MRLRIRITGAVQGVGFRPHVYRMAGRHGLAGFVLNSAQGVLIEVEGASATAFVEQLRAQPPAHAVIAGFSLESIADLGDTSFTVRHSDSSGQPAAYLLPDLAICDACQAEIRDPANRRFRYPFTTCTDCGPRFSIAEGLPYDRPLTTMRHFPMCAACQSEYDHPADRRFHAQTNCCPACGPQLELWSAAGETLAREDDALCAAAEAVRAGRILALKGMGGFHLICDARNRAAVQTLRQRKRRPAKPFAVMVPEHPDRLLYSVQAPIVLVENTLNLPDEIAPGNPLLGVLRPYSPLHVLLMDELRFPIVATSGNLTDEPICFDEHEALRRLGAIADVFLVHNRPILRPLDDSIVRVIDGAPTLLRRARGYAPLPFVSPVDLPEMIATGAHDKNTVACSRGRLVFVSQHIGDLSTVPALDSHRRALADLRRTYELRPVRVAHDLHPDYASTREALATGLPACAVQHHHAHVYAGILEHQIAPPLLGVAWDGTGYGLDGTVWGGEYLAWDGATMERVAHLPAFPLPGGERAVREPRRSLLGLLHSLGRRESARKLFTPVEWPLVTALLDRGLNAPLTTSAGRVFDAVAALLGLCTVSSFEGEAAMRVEFSARECTTDASIDLSPGWAPLVDALEDTQWTLSAGAAMFHNALADSICRVAMQAAIPQVLLTGGCFQNALLAEKAAARLRAAGFRVYLHRALPPNDGAIAAGQIFAARGNSTCA